MPQWIDPQPTTPGGLASLGLSALVEEILLRRGVRDTALARAFLTPDTASSTPFPGIDNMIDCLKKATEEKATICVWGDFDVDGQTSTALLVDALRILGARVIYHVPNRVAEGHGVGLARLESILDGGVHVLLTCDTGITAHDAASYAKRRGVPFLITDHHDPDATLPDAAAIMNPKLLPTGHPLADLAGVGTAYKLAEALFQSNGMIPTRLLDLVSLGLVADLALLRAETRALAHRGIRMLRVTERLGLQILAEQAQVELQSLTEETIGFVLAPRLNALGRLGDAAEAVELLLTNDSVRAAVLAARIEALNIQRKLLTEQVYQAAEERLVSDATILHQPVIVLENASWPSGVLGIVASRLVERYRKPTILLARDQDRIWRGSARSIDGLHITQAISANREMLRSFGGHPMAAGLAFDSEQLPRFKIAIQQTVDRMLSEARIPEEVLQIDQWLPLANLAVELAMDLEQLAPFGPGNPVPVLATRGVQVRSSVQIGPGREHRRLVIVDGAGGEAEVLWWNAGDQESPAGKFDIAYSMRPRAFRGRQGITLSLIDMHVPHFQPPHVGSGAVQIVDLRGSAHPVLPPQCLVWAEAVESGFGVDRNRLTPANDLAIWTSPPGRSELQSVLNIVKPRTVYLVGRQPLAPHTFEAFLSRLASLTKFALNRRGGTTKIAELAAACAQRELTIQIGLAWLAAAGHVGAILDGDVASLSLGSGEVDKPLQRELAAGLASLLQETSAYRAYFSAAAAQTLLETGGSAIQSG